MGIASVLPSCHTIPKARHQPSTHPITLTMAGVWSKEDRPIPQLSNNVMDLFSLKGKYCVVTGAGSGIGLGVVRAFLDAGCAGVCMTYNSNAKTVELAKELVDKCMEEFGRIDVFVANAGMGAGGAVTEMD